MVESQPSKSRRLAGVIPQCGREPAAETLSAAKGLKGLRKQEGGSNSVVESQPSKLLVAGSIPVSRSRVFDSAGFPSCGRLCARWGARADVAQLVEHSLGKGEVTSSILVIGSTDFS